MKTKIFSKLGFLALLGILLVNLAGCCPPFCPTPESPTDCSKRGTHSLFVATFDSDTVGSLPAPTSPLHYGPPGASLDLQNGTNTVVIIDSASLASKAVKITRGNASTIIDAVTGVIGGVPHTAGVYYIDFKAHGEVVPQYLIAGMSISVRSAEDRSALSLKLFDGSYHLLEGSAYSRLAGAYDPGTAHSVHIELNMDTKKYSICIDNVVVAENKTFLHSDFTNLHSVRFFAPGTVTEAFSMTYVADDIRITK